MKPADEAQVLSPAALMMAALSMWPVPTRLLRTRAVSLGVHADRAPAGGRDVSVYLEST